MASPTLPLDILVHILHWLHPTRALLSPSVRTLVNFSASSSLLREAASLAAVWEPHYRARYRHCHRGREDERRASVKNHWKDLYAIRHYLDREALDLVHSIMIDVHSRRDATYQLLDLGMDVWDALSLSYKETSLVRVLDNCDVQLRSDPLTWSYWTESLARGLTMQDAVVAWSGMLKPGSSDEAQTFEESQCYVSSFFGVPQADVMDILASLALRCKAYVESKGIAVDPHSTDYRLSTLCRAIFVFMKSERLIIAIGPQVFGQVMNKFPHAYLTTHKATIPLSLTHIFCCIAKHLRIAAAPINFPGCVLIHVPRSVDGTTPPLILNPSAAFLSQFILNERDDWSADTEFGAPVFPGPYDHLLTPSQGIVQMLTRTSSNILNSIRDSTATGKQKKLAAISAMCFGLLIPVDGIILQGFFALPDVSALDAYILYRIIPAALIQRDGLQHRLLREHCSEAIQQEEREASEVKRRTEGKSPEFFVGMGIKHVKHKYQGVIYGWDTTCQQSERWIQDMGVDQLTRGRDQPFYKVSIANDSLPASTSPRYVAEENITPIEVDPAMVTSLFQRIEGAGKHFGNVAFERNEKGWGWGRLTQSLENKAVYPDDEEYAVSWVEKTRMDVMGE